MIRMKKCRREFFDPFWGVSILMLFCVSYMSLILSSVCLCHSVA